ncbi:UDP-N-acetylmuramoylalanyl-D-glutamyl-2,6-diaminopimelate--D-alanyl-D-alanine ligase [Jiella pelagia]|uniref:UDP-N-acetylmuramoyl-tripeptide--D-alanyl-D-alanine ligase n=1 Tax=Jiella pelagia TaxID=2986949 RepID=A0ABY7C2X2_9HYPH|nr:UDP-N-acetylmuramoylalanyl-D-glutamyl-2,6-diaminopimelate--D-alanyl-D-alanine ligase [Jiella pelagia]WAP69220.1 UDP-N-acetylmuramoylalanyl-D-glutamyl-2,6-diaminopimelate--D-alanyl-D-alanine ligase [Jiella pelagia]
MTELLWETGVLIDAMQARPMGDLPEGVTGISIDTRTMRQGEAFFAIKGERFDGHDFLSTAQRGGAGIAVVAEQKLPALGRVQIPMLVVDDVLKALSRLAEAARARSKAKIVAVTGSVGKTTTKEALRHGLSAVGSVHASAASFNNHWGVPLSLALLPAETSYAVFEIGMNHPDEIRPLVGLVRPHVAIVTLIAPAHLGHFRDLDEIAEAKAEIFEGVVPGGTAILNGDDEKCGLLANYARKAGVANIMTFGEGAGADFRLIAYEATREGAKVDAEIAGEPLRFSLATPGRHMAQNVLAVLGAAHRIGADVDKVASALAGWRAVKGRGARHQLALSGGSVTLVDDSYNANPASMRAALDVLSRAEPGKGARRIAVLGDMLELGTSSSELHAALKDHVLAAKVDMVFLAGQEMKALDVALANLVDCRWHENNDELLADLEGTMAGGDVVMVKASKSIGFSRLVETLLSRHEDQTEAKAPVAESGSAMAEKTSGETK